MRRAEGENETDKRQRKTNKGGGDNTYGEDKMPIGRKKD